MTTVFVIGTVGVPACYGGFESLVQNLVDNQSKSFKYNIFCSDFSYNDKIDKYKDSSLYYLPFKANGISSIPYDILSLLVCLRKKPDVILILGVSGCLFLPIYRFFSRSKIVTNIDGLEWKRDKWSKFTKWFLKFSESMAVKFSDVIITDNKAIGDYVDTEYSKSNVVIAYGGDHAIVEGVDVGPTGDYFLSLCRIEPENNVQMILEAFENSQQKLKFVGNWDASEFGRALKRKFSVNSNIQIIDPIYDINKLYKLRSECKGYIHGHSAGGTNPSLVEAMHFGKPIFAFDCAFNRYSTEDKALFFISSQDLDDKLSCATKNDLVIISKNMKQIAESRYTWKTITQMYEATYL